MNVSFIVTLVGSDRPGLVSTLAERAAANGANWLDSSMAHLAGKFAGIVRLDVAAADADRLEAALRELSSEGLSLSIERGTSAAAAGGGEVIRLELLAHDRPGIVRDISSVLAQHGASIERIDSACESASFSGEAMFRAELEVRVPASVSAADVQAALESLANELMVDLKLEAGA
ncbi:MAG: glycine cleavage system protein R [Thauera sp.]